MLPSLNGSPPNRSPSPQRGKSVRSSSTRTSPGRRKACLSSSNARHGGDPPPLLPADNATSGRNEAPAKTARKPRLPRSREPPAATNILPDLLTNPIHVNYTGKHMDLEERRVRLLVDGIPETLKAIKRMCVGLSSAAARGEKDGASGRWRASAAPAPAASHGVVVAAKRTCSFSPTPPSSDAGGTLAGTGGPHGGHGGLPAPASSGAAEAADIDRIIERVRLVEALLFPLPALQTARPFALPVLPKAALRQGHQRRPASKRSSTPASTPGKECSSALSYYHSTLHSVSPKRRHLAWKALLHKSTNAFALLLGSLRCEGVVDTPAVCAELVTLLYNILRNIPSTSKETSEEKERKAVKFCEKMGMVKVLSAMMRRYHAELQSVERKSFGVEGDAEATGAARRLANEVTVERYQCLRVLEATVLLYTEVAKVNVKVNAMLRLSKDLRRTLDSAHYVSFECVLRTLQSHTKLSDFGCQAVSQVTKGVSGVTRGSRQSATREALTKNRREAVKALENVSRNTSFYLAVLAHLLMTVFMSTRTALGAQEAGAKAVALGARVAAVLSEFLYTTLPKVRRVMTVPPTKAAGAGKDVGEDHQAPTFALREPAWVPLYKRRAEMALFWAIAVVQRICENDKKGEFLHELHESNHMMASLFLVLKSTGREGSRPDVGAATVDAEERSNSVETEQGDAAGGGRHYCRRRSSTSRSPFNRSFAGDAYEFSGYHRRSFSVATAAGGGESEQGDVMDENEEMTLAAMATMNAILKLNRPRALAELAPVCGGLAGVVKETLKFHSDAPEQWHRYLMLLTAMYGVRLLPAKPGESAYEKDTRLPPHMLSIPQDDGADASVRQACALSEPPPPWKVAHHSRSPVTATSAEETEVPRRPSAPTPRGEGSAHRESAAKARSPTTHSAVSHHESPSKRSPTTNVKTIGTPSDCTSRSPSGPNAVIGGARLAGDEHSWRTLDSAKAQTPPPSPSLSSHCHSPVQPDADDGDSANALDSATSTTVTKHMPAGTNAARHSGEMTPTGNRVSPPTSAAAGGAPLGFLHSTHALHLVDRRPAALSPELRLGECTQENEAPDLDAEASLEGGTAEGSFVFPWRFDEAGPPATNHISQHQNERDPPLSMQDVSPAQKISVLKHQISRLRALTEASTDDSTNPLERHQYTVVYERGDAMTQRRQLEEDIARTNGAVGNTDHRNDEEGTHEMSLPSANGETAASGTPLHFTSNFESGNLKRAVKVTAHEYDLVMNWDTSTNGFTQWFLFGLSGYEPGATYRFNVLNMEKMTSCFNAGQRPLMLWVPRLGGWRCCHEAGGGTDSTCERCESPPTSKSPMRPSEEARPADWQRVGHDIYYYRNAYGRPERSSAQGCLLSLPTFESVGLSRVTARAEGRQAMGRPRDSRSNSNTTPAGSRVSPAAPSALVAKTQDRTLAGRRHSGKPRHALSPGNRSRDLSTSSKSAVVPTATSARSSPQRAAVGSGRGDRGISPRNAPLPISAATNSPTQPAASGHVNTHCAPPADTPEFSTNFYTLSFSVTMPLRPGRVYLTNCFPYTYTDLRHHLDGLVRSREEEGASDAVGQKDTTGRYFAVQSLCRTLGGLPVPIVTVTARRRAGGGSRYTVDEIRARPVCVITARIHPGESNSSWMMHGMLEALLRSHVADAPGGIPAQHQEAANRAVQQLLHSFVFKLVPMLNPDGVVMGNHRCSLAGVDLNRDYLRPDAEINPTIYAIHRYVRHMIEKEERAVVLFADLHGHSVAKNFLMYGCTEALAEGLARRLAKERPDAEAAQLSPTVEDPADGVGNVSRSPAPAPVIGEGPDTVDGVDGAKEPSIAFEKLFPILLAHATPSFGLSQCSFSMQKTMRGTGRIIQYRKYGIRMSYTVEGTMAGGTGAGFVCRWEAPRVVDRGEPGAETHYTQDGYCALGHSFLSTLRTMLAVEHMTRHLTAEVDNEGAVPVDLLRLVWGQLSLSGTGRAAPSSPAAVELPNVPATAAERVGSGAFRAALDGAGPYVLATRNARRTGQTPLSSHHGSPLTGSPLQPSYTMAPEPERAATAQEEEHSLGSTNELADLAAKYQTAMRFLFSTATSRVPDDGENEEDNDDDDDDSDGGGARGASSLKRRATPTGGAAGRRKKVAGVAAAVRRSASKSVSAVTGKAIAGRDAPAAATRATNSGNSPSPPRAAQSRHDSTHAGEDAAAVTATSAVTSPTAETECFTEATGSPRDDTDKEEEPDDNAVDDDDGGTFVVSLSDDDDVDGSDASDADDEDGDEAAFARTPRTEYADGDADGATEGSTNECERIFVDNGSDEDFETDVDEDNDDEADYGELEPMPSNVFS